MVPYCHGEYQMRLIQAHHLARMIRMREINDVDVTMTVETVTVIKEIKEVVQAMEVYGQVYWEKDKSTPCLTSTYRQCLVSMRNSITYLTALTLFDTGAYTSFVNREVAKWLEQQQT